VREPTGTPEGRQGTPRPLRGRRAELAEVQASTTRVQQTRSMILVVTGAAGIGKSRLATEIAARAGRGVYDPCRDAERVARLWPTVVDAASRGPVCVCLDDVDRLDTGAVAALRATVDEVAESRVLWCWAMRPAGGRPDVRDAIASILERHDGSVRRIDLGALPADEVALVTRDVLGADPNGALRRLTDMAHGNPALLVDLLVGLVEDGRVSVADGKARITGRHLPQRTTATLQRRLARMSPGAHRTVQVASVLPSRFSAATLARALRSRPSRMAADVDEAIRGGFLAEDGELMAFRHSLVRKGLRQLAAPTVVTREALTAEGRRT